MRRRALLPPVILAAVLTAACRAPGPASASSAPASAPAPRPSAPAPKLADGKLELRCPVNPALARALPPAPGAPPAYWHERAWGFEQALAEQARNPLPLLLYFKTEWCPYCKRLDEGLLFPDGYAADLGPVIRVVINPEEGPQERALALRFDVKGYPDLRLLPPGARDGDALRLDPYGDEPIAERTYPLLALPEFRARIAAALDETRREARRELRNAALSLDGERVARAAAAALALDPRSAELRRAVAVCYQRVGLPDQAAREFAIAAGLDPAGAREDFAGIERALAPAFRWNEVAGCWSIHLQSHPRDGVALARRAAALDQLGVPAAAAADRVQACAAGHAPACKAIGS